ncbi:hypothetical protein [Streptomyces celluloflavus]|uniref:hypothetical protein n=1 Tax=Streptomyces celluloflavus TaxID=58344 RepID=UPI00364EE36B
MILRRYHQRPDTENDDQAAADEQHATAPRAKKPAGRSAAPGKAAKKTDGG